MSLYSIALFLHIVGALLLFALLTVEGVSFGRGMLGARFNRVAGPISAVLVLFPGLYMMATTWGWKPWIGIGLTGWILIAIGGAATGVLTLRGRIDQRVAAGSLGVRVGMTLGIVFSMTIKPDAAGALLAVVIGAVLGLGGAFLLRPARRPAVA